MNEINIQAVSLVSANKSEIRKNLKGIYFTGEEAVSTDGVLLARTKSSISKGLRVAEPYQKLKKNNFIGENGQIKNDNGVFTPKTIDGEFPNYKMIIPKEGDNEHLKVRLSISVIEKLIKSTKKTGERHIDFSFNDDNNKPIVAVVGEVEYLVMPMRSN